MSILSKYFDKIYCINLNRRPDRWFNVTKEFVRVGFDEIERFEATDGETMDLTEFGKLKMTRGHFGIIDTQFRIIKEAKEKGYKNILILEDDVYFSEEIGNLISYMDLVPNDWDMLYFGGSHNHGLPPTKINDKNNKIK